MRRRSGWTAPWKSCTSSEHRGATLSAAALGTALATEAVTAAPAGLAGAVTAAALSGTTITTTAAIAATKAIAMTTLQKTVITAAFAVAVGTGVYEAQRNSTLRSQVQTLQQQQAPLIEQIQQLQRERARRREEPVDLAGRRECSFETKPRLICSSFAVKLANCELASNDPINTAAKGWLAKVNMLKQRLELMPDKKIPRASVSHRNRLVKRREGRQVVNRRRFSQGSKRTAKCCQR